MCEPKPKEREPALHGQKSPVIGVKLNNIYSMYYVYTFFFNLIVKS